MRPVGNVLEFSQLLAAFQKEKKTFIKKNAQITAGKQNEFARNLFTLSGNICLAFRISHR